MQPRLDGGGLYWLESRPSESGRTVLVHSDGGKPEDLLPAPYSVRSRVHEYGGGAYTVSDGQVFFVNDADQCIYTLRGNQVVQLTAAGTRRYGDLLLDRLRERLVCVCEDHGSAHAPPLNFLAAVSLADGKLTRLAEGADFYSSPALSPEGGQLAWLEWSQPQMPWEGCELWLARINTDGALKGARRIAGGPDESIFQPRFSPDGRLYFVSDQSGWWNIYRYESGEIQAVAPDEADYGYAQWSLGMSSYGFLSAREIAAVRIHQGVCEAVRVDLVHLRRKKLSSPCTQIDFLDATGQDVTLIGASPQAPAAVLLSKGGGAFRALRRTAALELAKDFISVPQSVSFPTSNGEIAHAWYYLPTHPEWHVPQGELPPLIVKCHGGPTAMNGNALEPKIQFWTSRGFAVADVNYRGSTGYGRAYRDSLHGQWGEKDVADCVNAAVYFTTRKLADPRRLIVSGSSAGGFTALAALAFHRVFHAASVYYGVSELATAMTGTHKFEAHYGESLLGPWPAARALYRARSPLYSAAQIRAAVIFFQGLRDAVVLPEQTEKMLEALKRNALPTACLTFPEEGHGFRRAETLRATLQAELVFYSRIFGFKPSDSTLPALEIFNLP